MTPGTEQTKQYSAFISHASADADKAIELVEALESKGLTVWVAPRDIVPGREYGEEIIRGIDQSNCFVLLVSQASNLSSHVRREVERAASKSKPIYPVRIEDVPPSPKLEYYISMHQWLDALDGVMAPHANRLAAAIASDEEWVGNRVFVRRRRWRLGAGLTTAVLAIAIVAGMVFAPDLRSIFQSGQQRAAAKLASRGLSIDGDGLARAMAAANAADLELYLEAGLGAGQMTEAFVKSGEDFLTRSRGNSSAILWLKAAVAAGLDPNLTLPSEHYGREALIASAVRSGNADAVVALLEAGASPHAYQDLFLSPYSLPRFLFPYEYVLNHKSLSGEERDRVARAMDAAGAFIVPPEQDTGGFDYDHQRAFKEVTEATERLGLTSAVMPSGCGSRPPTPICEAATRTTGKDWCKLVADLPKRVQWNPESYNLQLLGFNIHHLLTVIDGRGYVLATSPFGYDNGYALLEIGADEQTWTLYTYVSPGAGLGHCKPYINQPDYRPDNCWRRFSMRWEPEREVVRLSDYYDYSALDTCERALPGR
jgi:hypothetical protein